MSASLRFVTPGVRLSCEPLEDRATPAAAYALSGAALLSFDTTDAADATSTAVTGVVAGETLVGIDFRASDGLLYGLGVNATTDKATLYTISLETGAATAVGAAGSVAFVDSTGKPVDLPASTGYAVSFDPAADQLRVVTGSGLNFRVDPATGAPIDGDTGLAGSIDGVNPDGAINGLPTGSFGVTGSAFTGAAAVGDPVTQYTLDAASNSLFIQGAGSSGTQTGKLTVTLNGTPLDFTAVSGFDIPDAVTVATPGAPAAGTAVAALVVGGTTRIYEIDLITGAATEVGAAPTGATSLVLSNAAPKTVEFTSATFTGTEAGRNAEITLTRTGDPSKELTVSVLVTGGTATAGVDFAGGSSDATNDDLVAAGVSYVVTFAAGSATATLNIPIVDDHAAEPSETITLTLSDPSAGTVGAQATTEVTIEDSGAPAPMPTVTADSVVVGTGLGFGAVWILNPDGTPRGGFLPYGDTMIAGVKVATADVNGDGVKDIITAPGMFLAHIKVFDGATGAEIRSFNAFDPSWFFLGVNIAAGDVDGDGKAEVVVATATGSTHVKVFDGATGNEGANFYAFAGSLTGVNIAVGDVNGDGHADLVAGTAGGLSNVKTINLSNGAALQNFVAYPGYGYGVSVAVGDVDGDGQADIVTGTAGVGAQVKVFNASTGAQSQNYFAFPMAFGGGIHVAAKDVTGDGIPDVLVSAAAGTDQTKFFDGATGKEVRNFLAFGIGFPGGVFIG